MSDNLVSDLAGEVARQQTVIAELVIRLKGAANYIDRLGGVSTDYRMDITKHEAEEQTVAAGEPVAEVVSQYYAGLYDILPIGTMLYTSAPTMPEGWPSKENFVFQIGECGWRSTCDAQWEHIGQLYDNLTAMLAAAPKPEE